MADFSITGEVKLNSDPAEQSVNKWTVAAGNLIADFVKSASGQVSELVSSAIDGGAALQQSIGGVETLFKDSAETVKANAAEAYKTTGLSANAYMEQTTSFAASLLSSLGNDTDEAARVAHMAMVDMSDNANKMGTDMSAIQNAYQGFAKQNYTMLDNLKLGYGGTKTEMERLLADAEAFSGVHYDINNLSDVYNAIHVVQNELGITGTTAKEAATTISGSAAAMQASWENVLANLTLGEDLKPALESLVDTTKTYLCGNLLPAVGNIVSGIPQIITSIAPEILDAGSEFLDVGLELVSNLGSGLVQGIPDLLSNALLIIADLASGLRENAGKIVDAGLDLIVNLATGLMNGLPQIIAYLPGIVSDIAGIINDNAPKLLAAGVELIVVLGKGLLQAVPSVIANLPQICQAIFDVFTAFRWLDIGGHIVDGLWNGLKSGWTGLIAKVKGLADMLPDVVKKVLGIHSPSKVFDEIGLNICKGLAQGLTTNEELPEDAAAQVVASVTNTATTLVDGIETVTQSITEILKDGTPQQKQIITSTGKELIDGVERTVKTVTTIAADGTKTVSKTIEDAGPQFSSAAELLTYQFTEKLNSSWEQINKSIQSDVIGSIQTLFKAIQDGDLESIATWSAAYFWNACTQEQRTQIQTFAMDALSKLSSSLSGVFQNVAGLASSFVSQFVPAVAAATTGQTALNVAMDANPIMLVISLIGMLVGALVSFASTNKDVASGFQRVWQCVEDVISVVFEGMLRFIGLSVQGFVSAVNTIIDTYNWVAKALKLSTISRVSNPLWDQADKIAAKRKENQAKRKASSEAKAAQAALDTQYAQDSGAAEKKQLEAEYAKKAAELAKAKLSSDSPGMLDAEKNVAAADYTKSLADLEKKLLDAQYKKASAELSKRTETDAVALAELEKQIAEADNTIRSGDLEKELLRVNYEKTLKELEAKYQPKNDNTSSGGSGSGSTGSNSDDLATKINDLEKSYDQKLQELKNTYTNKSEAQSAEYERKLAAMKADYEKQLASMKNQLAESKTTYEKQLAELKKQHNSSSGSSGSNKPDPAPESPAPTLPDNTGAIEDNTAAILAANEKLAEMVRQANSLVLSDNMAVSRSVAASGTAQIAAAANNYHRDGDTNIVQNIYSKAQTAADLARETRWEADRAKAAKR